MLKQLMFIKNTTHTCSENSPHKIHFSLVLEKKSCIFVESLLGLFLVHIYKAGVAASAFFTLSFHHRNCFSFQFKFNFCR